MRASQFYPLLTPSISVFVAQHGCGTYRVPPIPEDILAKMDKQRTENSGQKVFTLPSKDL